MALDRSEEMCVVPERRALRKTTCNLKMHESKRRQNENKFASWERLPDGGRRYWYDVNGRHGWKARYVKEVDTTEVTLRFYQEIYDDQDTLVEVHHKYPVDTGHVRVAPGERP